VSAGKTVSWRQISPAPLVILDGPESYLAQRALGLLKTGLRNLHPDLEISELAESGYQAGELLSYAAPSLFAAPRLIISNSVSAELLADLDSYMNLAVEDCTVVVRAPNAVGQNGKLRTQFGKRALTVSTPELKKDAERADFVKQEFAERSITIDQPAIRALMQAFATDLGELGAACDQLAAASSGRVGLTDVEQAFQGRVETNAFKIADAALNGDAAEAVRLYRHGFSTGVDNIALAAALTMRIRLLAKLFNDPASNAASLGVAPWQLDKARRELRRFTEQSLIDLVELAAQTDAELKGLAKDPSFAMERFILAIAGK
jgi:DNA polymerase III subunit delta